MPEKKLLAAILERAIIDATGRAKDIPIDERTLARIWLKDASIARWSFNWVCDNLGLDGEIVRKFVWQADTNPINLNCNKKKNTLPSDNAIRIRRRRVAAQLPPKPRRARCETALSRQIVDVQISGESEYIQLSLPLEGLLPSFKEQASTHQHAPRYSNSQTLHGLAQPSEVIVQTETATKSVVASTCSTTIAQVAQQSTTWLKR